MKTKPEQEPAGQIKCTHPDEDVCPMCADTGLDTESELEQLARKTAAKIWSNEHPSTPSSHTQIILDSFKKVQELTPKEGAVAQQPLVDALEYITNFGGDCFHHDEVVNRAKAALANIVKHGTE